MDLSKEASAQTCYIGKRDLVSKTEDKRDLWTKETYHVSKEASEVTCYIGKRDLFCEREDQRDLLCEREETRETSTSKNFSV